MTGRVHLNLVEVLMRKNKCDSRIPVSLVVISDLMWQTQYHMFFLGRMSGNLYNVWVFLFLYHQVSKHESGDLMVFVHPTSEHVY